MMASRDARRLWLVAGVLALQALPFGAASLRAEGYGDWFLYDANKLPKHVLVDTIGIAMPCAQQQEDETVPLSQRAPRLSATITRFQSYERKGGKFVPAAEIPIDDTLPAGKGGYGGWVRYLVTARSGAYVQIIIDPYRDRRRWIKPEKDRVILFSELIGRRKPIQEEIDIFVLSAETKLYSEPRLVAAYETLRRDELQGKVYYPIVFRRDFVQIGVRRMEERGPSTVGGEPVGWVRARDDEGRLAFYLYTHAWY
jgi:hypothetical protein